MSIDEANDIAATLRGLMPRMTDDQMVAVRDELLKVSDGGARARLTAYAKGREDFDLKSAVEACHKASTTATSRTMDAINEQRKRDAETRRERLAVTTRLAAMDVLEIDRIANEIITTLSDGGADAVDRKLGWRGSYRIQALIVEQLDRKAGAIAEPDRKTLAAGGES
ncbi:MAG: hypothetical protein QM754_18320 [Tepidisphaeraceae bacterium]